VAGAAAYREGGGIDFGSLVGRGDTIAFTSFGLGRRETRTPWLLLARHGSKCPGNGGYFTTPRHLCRRLAGAAGGITSAADADRVLTATPNGEVRLVSTRGKLLRKWRLRPRIVEAKLRGRVVAVQHGFSVDLYDTVTGANGATLPLAPDEGGTATLLDVQGNLAAYATGGAIHLLRFSDGRDVALNIPSAAPPLEARLERRGLFVTWNQMYRRQPGRLAFVPLRSITARLG
jgi:hypothetical protein